MDQPAAKGPATSPITVTADSRMSEDFILSVDILLNPQSDHAIAAVRLPNGKWTALAIVADTGLVHVIPDATSHSGWNTSPIPNGKAVVEVVTGVDAPGANHAFFQDGKNTYHMILGSDGKWSPRDQFPFSQNLGVAYIPLFGEIVAYGITTAGNLLLMRNNPSAGGWQASTCDMKGGLQGGQAILNMTDAQSWTLAAAVSGQLQLFTGSGTNLASGPQVVATKNSIPRIHFVYDHLNSTMVMFSDDKNNLYTSVGFSDVISPIPNSQVVQGTGIIGPDHMVHFYAADPTGKMWVLHQKAWDSNNAPVWAHMFPLDVNTAAVTSPLRDIDNRILFTAGVDQTLHILSQNAVTQHWTRTKLQGPSTEVPYHLTRYRTQLTVTDPYENPARNVPLTITATSETDIFAGGKSYLIGPGPGQAATLTTDFTGVLTLTRIATSLVAPQYIVSSPNLPTPLTVYPDARYHSFLAGKSPINTGSAVIPNMSAETLMQATVNGQPLAPKLTSKNATLASQGIISGMRSVPGSSAAVSTAAGAGWALDFRDPQNGQYLTFATKAELDKYLGSLRAGGPDASSLRAGQVGDFRGDIAAFFGDIWHAIESAAMAVVDWIVDTVESIISFVIKIGEDLIQLAALAIKTIEDAIPFIHAIFNFIGALVDKVLDWVKDLIGWQDIWNTKKVFENFVVGATPILQSFLKNTAPIQSNHFFGNMKAGLDAELRKVQANYLGRSIHSLGTSSAVATRIQRLTVAASSNPSQKNWILSKVKENVGSSVLDPLTSNPPPNVISAFWDALAAPGVRKDFNEALDSLSKFFAIAFTDPQAFASQGVADLIAGIRHLADWALDFLDTLVDKILNLLDASLTAIQDVLNQPLGNIPLVSWLYTNVICPSDQQEPLTILHVCCLILAFPVTLTYKLAHDMTPPFSSSQAEMVRSASHAARENPGALIDLASALRLGSPTVIDEVNLYLSIIQGCADVAADTTSLEEPPGDFFALIAGWVDLAVNFVMQVLSWPGKIFSFNWDWSSFTPGQTLTRAAWLLAWNPILGNGIMMVQPTPQGGELIEGVQDGLLFLCFYGGLILATGAAGASKSLTDPDPTNADDIAAAIFAPLGNLAQFLRFDPVIEASEGFSAVLKLVVDILGDIGAGAAQYNASTSYQFLIAKGEQS